MKMGVILLLFWSREWNYVGLTVIPSIQLRTLGYEVEFFYGFTPFIDVVTESKWKKIF